MEEELGFTPPFTLGHESAGWVADRGRGVTAFTDGEAGAVYGPWGCGRCHACQRSAENYCENWVEMGGFGGGLGFDGGMAEYMLVPSARLLVPLGDLSPAKAAPRGDAALTPYHAIRRALPHLHADSTVVVLGAGGLGHMEDPGLPRCRPGARLCRGAAHDRLGREAPRARQRLDDTWAWAADAMTSAMAARRTGPR